MKKIVTWILLNHSLDSTTQLLQDSVSIGCVPPDSTTRTCYKVGGLFPGEIGCLYCLGGLCLRGYSVRGVSAQGCFCLEGSERDNPYHFFRTNQQKVGNKIYSLTQSSLSVNEYGTFWWAMTRELIISRGGGVCPEGGLSPGEVSVQTGVLCHRDHTPPFPRGQNDARIWKYYPAPNFVCGR